MDVVPFVHRDEQRPSRVYRPLYRTACLPSAEAQRQRLEALRHKWGGYRHGLRFMQRLGDVGRKWWPVLAGLRVHR